jgi:hypothetical protein
MKKQYIKCYVERMRYDINYYFKMISFYNRDLARANRIESDLFSLSDNAINAAHDFTGINPRELIIELRDPKYINAALIVIARTWRYTSITKEQRALLGKSAMQKINSIYKTL